MSDLFDVITYGEAMLLMVAHEVGPLEQAQTLHKRTAGAETNVAIGLSRLGLRVGWASRLGTDSMGRYLIAAMQAEGIDCSRVVCDPLQRTGFQFKTRVTNGSDPYVESHRKGSAASHMGVDDVDSAWLLSARHLHATGIFPALSASTLPAARLAMTTMRAAGRTVSYDPNLRPGLWPSTEVMRTTLNELASHADWIFPGLEEGLLLTGESTPEGIAQFYLNLGASLVVVKLGSQGAYFQSAQESGYVAGFPVVTVVDTVGAGDGFAAGVISALLEGLSPRAATQRGAWIGARAVQVLGDSEGLPTRAELDAAALNA